MNVTSPKNWAPETQVVGAWLALAVLLLIGTLFGLSIGFVGLVLGATFIVGLIVAVRNDIAQYPPLSPVEEIKDNWNSVKTKIRNRFSGQNQTEFPVGNENPVMNSNENPVDYPAGNTNLYDYEVENGDTTVSSNGTLTSVGLVEGPYEPTVVLDTTKEN